MLVLLLSIGFSLWVTLIFPALVFVISLYILDLNLRIHQASTMNGVDESRILVPQDKIPEREAWVKEEKHQSTASVLFWYMFSF